MQELKIKGHTVEEIAKFTDYDPQYVRVILAQPWAQKNIVDNIKKSVQDEIKEFLEAEVLPSLRTLTSLRDSDETPAAVRQTSAVAIIDRLLGRPNQPISTQQTDPTKLTIDELNSRVAAITAGMATQTGNTPQSE
jgi:hypothetical protein